jgi:signal transduction histidine kinase
LITLGSIAICIGLLGWWAARSLTLPLRSFARAAENFSPEGEIAPLPERGPYEIKTAARALNHMRERIKGLVDDRTRMLAAVGHDLRTPITRLRLRSEFIEDDSARAEMLRDLDQMNAMVESVLLFLQNGKAQGVMTTIDLASKSAINSPTCSTRSAISVPIIFLLGRARRRWTAPSPISSKTPCGMAAAPSFV